MEQHQLDLPIELHVKKDMTKDLLTIFLACITVNLRAKTMKLLLVIGACCASKMSCGCM